MDTADADFRPAPLNAAQQEVLDLLGAGLDERPTFAPALRAELREMLTDALASVVPTLPADENLWVGKRHLSSVHGCEAKLVAEDELPFEWNVPIARGTVAHKAIELSVNWQGEVSPLHLVDEATASLIGSGDKCGRWLSTCGETAQAEVRAQANDRVTKFLECFPPLKKAWRPVTESSCRVELHDGRIVLAGKIDLSLGQAVGSTSGKVLIDLKTGGFVPRAPRRSSFLRAARDHPHRHTPTSARHLLPRQWPDTGRVDVRGRARGRRAPHHRRRPSVWPSCTTSKQRRSNGPGPPAGGVRFREECDEGIAFLADRDGVDSLED